MPVTVFADTTPSYWAYQQGTGYFVYSNTALANGVLNSNDSSLSADALYTKYKTQSGSLITDLVPSDAYFGIVGDSDKNGRTVIYWYTANDYNEFHYQFHPSRSNGIITVNGTSTKYYCPIGDEYKEPNTWYYIDESTSSGTSSYIYTNTAMAIKSGITNSQAVYLNYRDDPEYKASISYSVPDNAVFGVVLENGSVYWYDESSFSGFYKHFINENGIISSANSDSSINTTYFPISSATTEVGSAPEYWAYLKYPSEFYSNTAILELEHSNDGMTNQTLYENYVKLFGNDKIITNIPSNAYCGHLFTQNSDTQSSELTNPSKWCSSVSQYGDDVVFWYEKSDYNAFSSAKKKSWNFPSGIVTITGTDTSYYPIGSTVKGASSTWAYATITDVDYHWYTSSCEKEVKNASSAVVAFYGLIYSSTADASNGANLFTYNYSTYGIPSNAGYGIVAKDGSYAYWYTVDAAKTFLLSTNRDIDYSTGIISVVGTSGTSTYYPIGYKPTSTGSTSTVTTPAVTTPEETKPDETKPAETTPSDSKTETKPSAGIFADMTPAETVATVAVGTTAVAAGATAVYLIANPVVAMEVKAAADVAVAAVAQSVAASPLLGAGAEAVSAGVQAIGTAGVEAVSAGIQTAAASAQAVTAGVQAAAANVQAQVVAYVAPKIEAARNVINGFFAAVAA